MDEHLSRQELIRAARSGDSSRFQHLKKCRECRDAVSLIREYDFSGARHLADAPEELVENALRLALGTISKKRIPAGVANLTFDSWSEPLPVGVRGEALLGERRLRFEMDGLVFDLRAEQHAGRWVFIGVVSSDLADTRNVFLRVGGRKRSPDSTGVFHWESARPPRKIAIQLNDLTTVTLPELSWRRTSPR